MVININNRAVVNLIDLDYTTQYQIMSNECTIKDTRFDIYIYISSSSSSRCISELATYNVQ